MSDLLYAFPWLVVLIVYVGEKVQQWVLTHALNDALKRAQAPAVASPVAAAAPAVQPGTAKPVLVQPSDPPWYAWAQKEVGFHETGNNQGIEKYIALAKCGAPGDPWCAIFANAALEASGVRGTRSASSQSFRTDPNFVHLSGPAKGAIVVFWRISKDSGQGHVGFYDKEDPQHVWTLGGNEGDMVQDAPLPKDSASFGLIGYWWPKSVPLPTVGAIGTASPMALPSATNGKHTAITATVFGGQQSAYGGAINDAVPGVALPFRFAGERPRVRVTNPRSGASVDCDIVDVGPWNTNDPYWQSGSRPQAETGTDTRGRHTNKAGIDLTVAAANAIQIDGKGLVDWEFIEPSPVT